MYSAWLLLSDLPSVGVVALSHSPSVVLVTRPPFVLQAVPERKHVVGEHAATATNGYKSPVNTITPESCQWAVAAKASMEAQAEAKAAHQANCKAGGSTFELKANRGGEVTKRDGSRMLHRR